MSSYLQIQLLENHRKLHQDKIHIFHFLKSWLEKAQAGIKIAGRDINNLRYADDTTLMTESEEELKSLSTNVKGRVKKLA